jgi:hypothetical protein
LVDVDVREDPRSDVRFFVMSRTEQIQYVKLRGEPSLVEGVKTVIFEARSKEVTADWLFRIRKSAVMAHFLRGVVAKKRPQAEADATGAEPTTATDAGPVEDDE